MKYLILALLFCLTLHTLSRPFNRAHRIKEISPKKPGVFQEQLRCNIDPKLTVQSLTNNSKYRDQMNRYLWASSCPRSRGIFIIDGYKEYAGKTYSCANFPPQWGIKNPTDFFKNPADYAQHLKYLGLYFEGIFNTTAEKRPSTCDFLGFSKLYCGEAYEDPWKKAPWFEKVGKKPLRGVNAGGLFVLEPWITPNFTKWKVGLDDQYTFSQQNKDGSVGAIDLKIHWDTWYGPDDFMQMKKHGLNSVRLPVGWWYWAKEAGIEYAPYLIPDADIMTNMSHPITKFIGNAKQAGITVMVDLHGAPGSQNGLDNSGLRSKEENPEVWGYNWFYDPNMLEQTIKVLVVMAKYLKNLEMNQMDNVIAMELVNEPWVFGDMSIVRDFYNAAIPRIQEANPNLPLIVHDAFRHTEWAWLTNKWPFNNTFMDTHIYHAFNADDIASSDPSCDKDKQTVAENIACGYGSMLRYKTCVSLPTLVGEWSLAIDDCMGNIRGQDYSVQFHDFGQCKNLRARVGDPWWREHVNSFAARQMAMAERELGWYFWTWKTGMGAKGDPSNAYWSYVDAVQAGFINSTLTDAWIKPACNFFVDDGGKC